MTIGLGIRALEAWIGRFETCLLEPHRVLDIYSMVKGQKYHILYKTTCTVTGNFYIGVHSTTNLEDGYLGSGKRLRYSIEKHGKENHLREILEFFIKNNSRSILQLASMRRRSTINYNLVFNLGFTG